MDGHKHVMHSTARGTKSGMELITDADVSELVTIEYKSIARGGKTKRESKTVEFFVFA